MPLFCLGHDEVGILLRRTGRRIDAPTVELLDAVYEKGVKVCGKEKVELEQRLKRLDRLPLYDITIKP